MSEATNTITITAAEIKVGDNFEGGKVYDVDTSVFDPKTHTVVAFVTNGACLARVMPNGEMVEVVRR